MSICRSIKKRLIQFTNRIKAISISPKFLVLSATCLISGLSATDSAFATEETARPTTAFLDTIGVNASSWMINSQGHSAPIYTTKPLASIFQQAGIRHMRVNDYVGDNLGSITNNYTAIKALAAGGVKSQMIIRPTMCSLVPQTVAAYGAASFLRLEGPNEPDDTSHRSSNYAKTVQTCMQELSAGATTSAPSISIVGPSLISADGPSAVGNLDHYCHFGNVHVYPSYPESTTGDSGDTSGLLYQEKRDAVCYPKLPFIVSEFGWPTQGLSAVSERSQAKYITRGFPFFFNNGVVDSFAFMIMDALTSSQFTKQEQTKGLVNSSGNPVSTKAAAQVAADLGQNCYGIMHADGSPKPAYTWLSNMTNILKSSTSGKITNASLDFNLSGQTKNVSHTLLQASDGEFFLILWQGVPGTKWNSGTYSDIAVPYVPVKVSFTAPIKQLSLYDISWGTVARYTGQKKQSLTWNVPDYPLIVKISLEGSSN